MEWFEGISTWPTEYLRLTAVVLGLGLLVYGWTALRRQADEIQRAFFVPLRRRESASPCAARPAMEALRRIAHAFASGFPPAHDYFGRPEDCGTARVDAARLWHRYRRRTAFWPSAGRIATGVALAFAAVRSCSTSIRRAFRPAARWRTGPTSCSPARASPCSSC